MYFTCKDSTVFLYLDTPDELKRGIMISFGRPIPHTVLPNGRVRLEYTMPQHYSHMFVALHTLIGQEEGTRLFHIIQQHLTDI